MGSGGLEPFAGPAFGLGLDLGLALLLNPFGSQPSGELEAFLCRMSARVIVLERRWYTLRVLLAIGGCEGATLPNSSRLQLWL